MRLFNYLLFLLFLVACSSGGDSPAEVVVTPPEETPLLTDEELLTIVQQQTFNYFWEGAEVNSGAARERFYLDDPNLDSHVVATDATGFGLMNLIVGIERGFISRNEGVERIMKIVSFLENADRFHGVWPHWLDGTSGKTIPFSAFDDGGDLVETAFLAQGLLTVRQYLINGSETEKQLAQKIDKLWSEIEWSWHLNGGNTFIWHWSPNFGWQINLPIKGYNEALIVYVLAAASPSFPIPAEAYQVGWADNGNIKVEAVSFGQRITLKHNGNPGSVGPLFWAHYSYLGLNPHKLSDEFADYWEQNVAHARVHFNYAVANPKGFFGYGADTWGLTASLSVNGYEAHNVNNDLGVIAPTAALSSYPYLPAESLRMMRHLYEDLKPAVWGKFGFYDAFSQQNNWFPKRYIGIDQGPIPIMIENGRTGLLWDLFMSSPEVQTGLQKLNFSFR